MTHLVSLEYKTLQLMKNLILLFALLTTASCFAGKTDSTFQRHQISFSVTNGMSAALVNPDNLGGYDGASTSPYYPFTRATHVYEEDFIYHHATYIPNYSLHVKLEYSLGLSKSIRLDMMPPILRADNGLG
jgi:hypothetical protein